MTELRLVIPMEPPSGNHYKKPRIIGGGISWYHTKEAKAWFSAVANFATMETDGTPVEGKTHVVSYCVYQGHGSRGDVDNYAKCILDGLTRAGVLKSDASVVSLQCRKKRDRDQPRTEIYVTKLT